MTYDMLKTTLDRIEAAFSPPPVRCQLNGTWYYIERVTEGWSWRTENGDYQEDFGIAPFRTAAECQQSAMRHTRTQRQDALDALQEKRQAVWKSQPTINMAVTDPAKKRAYEARVEKWLADMREVDREIDEVKKGAAA